MSPARSREVTPNSRHQTQQKVHFLRLLPLLSCIAGSESSTAADSTQLGQNISPLPSSAAVAQATRSFSSRKAQKEAVRSGRREISWGL